MRRRRMLAPGGAAGADGKSGRKAYYHCVSRVVNREFVFGGAEKDRFRSLMRVYERFGCLRVVAYCLMSNHFHILVEVPERPAGADLPDDAGLVAHVRAALGEEQANRLEWSLRHWREIGANAAAEELRRQWFARMWDVSAFMKTLKQRFTQWHNGRKKRKGTLWEERFRSVLVEGECRALQTMAAYIDLNPVRAGICEDPKDYRWSGYGEAVAGGKQAKEAVRWLAELETRGPALGPKARAEAEGEAAKAREAEQAGKRRTAELEAMRVWRCGLFGVPEKEGAQAEERAKGDAARVYRRRIPRQKALEVLAQGGRLERADYLRCRVRYFTDGVAIGSREYVEGVFAGCREWFGAGRLTGSRSLRGMELAAKPERLYAMRALRNEAVG
jgi:putative transposase